jgi:hypothetical protein
VFLRYTVTWQDWSDAAVLPVKIFDVAACKVEYRVEECAGAGNDGGECVHVQTATQVLPRGGDFVFGVAHQHSGGIGASLHGDDGASPMRPTARARKPGTRRGTSSACPRATRSRAT